MGDDGEGDGAGEGRIFAGVRFALVGFDAASESQYRSEMLRRGGVDAGSYGENCTHVIVQGLLYDDPICTAARDNGKKVLTILWVDDCLRIGDRANADRVLYRPVKDNDGIHGCEYFKICSTGFTKRKNDDIRKLVTMMGARYFQLFIAHEVTHIVCNQFEGRDFLLAEKLGITAVSYEWLKNCLSHWRVMPVDNDNRGQLPVMNFSTPPSKSCTVVTGTRLCVSTGSKRARIQGKIASTSKVKRSLDDSFTSVGPDETASASQVKWALSDRFRSGGSVENDTGSTIKSMQEPGGRLRSSGNVQSGTSSISKSMQELGGRFRSSGNVQSETSSTSKSTHALNDSSRISGNDDSIICHHLVRRPLDASEAYTLHQLGLNSVVDYIRVPYAKNRKKMSKESVRLILRKAYVLMANHHIEDKSMAGQFDSKNFVISGPNQKVSLQGVELVRYSKFNADEDKKQFVLMVNKLFQAVGIPKDISCWLRLISRRVDDDLISHHIHMLDPQSAFGSFVSMFHTFLEVEKNDRKKYNEMVKLLSKYGRWKNRVFNYQLLEDTRWRKDPETNRPTNYESDVKGLLRLFRNTWEHPAKDYQKFLLAVLLDEERIEYLFSDLQEVLYNAGYLPQIRMKYLV